MRFPLALSFKIVALAPQIYVRDAEGHTLCYVRQKLFKLKEAVKVFGDESQTQLKYEIHANKILDFSAAYTITEASGSTLGSVRRRGMRSIFKAHYDLYRGDQQLMTISEENGLVKFIDGMIGEIPVLGMFTGYFFHPSYLMTQNNQQMLRITKQPAFFEGKFMIDELAPMDEPDRELAVLGCLMMLLLERARG